MLSFLRKTKLTAKVILTIFAFSLIGVSPASSPAQERYPAVARLSFVSGPVTYSRGDDPDEWDDAVENLPLTLGDRIYAPEDGRAELQLSSGNFVRVAPRSYLSTLNLSEDVKQFYLGEGAASFHIRRLQSDEIIEIDTPNVSVTLDEPGSYRVAVDQDGNSRITVRRGRASVAANGKEIAVENSEIRVYGIDSPRYEIVGLPATDTFDRWVAERDSRFERVYSDAYRHASEDIIGAEDLAEYGRWEEIPEYGYAWTPSRVAADWAPFNDGRWYWQDPWGWSWISNERWGWATSHYGRWTPHRSRWYWVPVRPRQRVRYAPACVEFVRVRDHVGWFPLHPRDRHVPWWERRDRRNDHQHVTYVNRNHVTVINHNNFISARPVRRHIVRDTVIIRDVRAARFAESLPIPNRSSLRVVAEDGRRRGHRPTETILRREAVVRTAPPARPRAFQEKLAEIQKNQGRAVEPARIFAARDDDRGRVRVRPAAEARGGDFAPRNPNASAGPAPQPLTERRGRKLASEENAREKDAAERTERAQKTPTAQPAQGEPGRSEARRERDLTREQDKSTVDRARQTQELERQKQAQQKEDTRKAQLQKQQQERAREQSRQNEAQQQRQQERERQAQQKEQERKAQAQKQQALERQQGQRSREQQRLEELERRQAQPEEQRKAQAQTQQNRQEQERREQLRQQQERQAQQQQQQRQQEVERREQARQQQDQARREQQLRQQQAQERQVREQQRQQQEIQRRQEQQQREQERAVQQQRQEEARAQQQLRQQQAQAQREAQQAQRQQEQERRSQPRQPQQERPAPQPQQQLPRQPGQF